MKDDLKTEYAANRWKEHVGRSLEMATIEEEVKAITVCFEALYGLNAAAQSRVLRLVTDRLRECTPALPDEVRAFIQVRDGA